MVLSTLNVVITYLWRAYKLSHFIFEAKRNWMTAVRSSQNFPTVILTIIYPLPKDMDDRSGGD
jgi:hypothetical protein